MNEVSAVRAEMDLESTEALETSKVRWWRGTNDDALRCSKYRGSSMMETKNVTLVGVRRVLQLEKVRAVRSNDHQTKVGK